MSFVLFELKYCLEYLEYLIILIKNQRLYKKQFESLLVKYIEGFELQNNLRNL